MKITITIECELDGELSNPGELGELLMDGLSGRGRALSMKA